MSLGKKVKNDPTINLICQNEGKEGSSSLGACYFNNTRCEDITDKLQPIRFIFGSIVYEIKIQAFLKDLLQDGQEGPPPPPP